MTHPAEGMPAPLFGGLPRLTCVPVVPSSSCSILTAGLSAPPFPLPAPLGTSVPLHPVHASPFPFLPLPSLGLAEKAPSSRKPSRRAPSQTTGPAVAKALGQRLCLLSETGHAHVSSVSPEPPLTWCSCSQPGFDVRKPEGVRLCLGGFVEWVGDWLGPMLGMAGGQRGPWEGGPSPPPKTDAGE